MLLNYLQPPEQRQQAPKQETYDERLARKLKLFEKMKEESARPK